MANKKDLLGLLGAIVLGIIFMVLIMLSDRSHATVEEKISDCLNQQRAGLIPQDLDCWEMVLDSVGL